MSSLLTRLPPAVSKQPIRFLDVGAGTGQFAAQLARLARERALSIDVTLLEPSSAFRDHLACSRLSNRCQIITRRLEDFEPEAPFQVILLSEVAHAFGDLHCVFSRLRDMTAPRGVIAFRYGSYHQVRNRNWYQFFPMARDIDLARAPCAEEYENMLIARGFECVTEEVDDSVDLTAQERVAIVADKAYSSFWPIDAGVFQDGLEDLTNAVATGSIGPRWTNQMTWTTARRLP